MISEKELNKRIGQNIKKYRMLYNVNKGSLTQSELSKKVDLSVSMIGCLESENLCRGISIYNLYKISKVLEIDIDKFFK